MGRGPNGGNQLLSLSSEVCSYRRDERTEEAKFLEKLILHA